MRYRALAIPATGVAAVLTGFLFFGNLNKNLVYYWTPSEAVSRRTDFPDGRRFRLAGLVVPGTTASSEGEVRFVLSDGSQSVTVTHRGDPPQLFQEGIQVVVEGAWNGDRFTSDTMIIKHSENYSPPGPAGTRVRAPAP